MATTLKEVILKHQKRSAKTWNVKIRVTHERQSAYISTEHYLVAKQISSDFKRIKDEFIADEVRKEIARLRIEISKLGAGVARYTAKSLAEYLDRKRKNAGEPGLFVFPFIEQTIKDLRECDRNSVANGYGALETNLREWLKRDNLEFREITLKFLRKFEEFLVKKIGPGTRGVESNLGYLRTIFNLARKEYNDYDLDDIKIPHTPFENYSIPKSKEPEKRSVELDLISRIRDYQYTKQSKYEHKRTISRPELSRDVFMLSFYLCGMNSKDIFLLRADQIVGDRIVYNRAKTAGRREDKALISIKLEIEALELFVKYKDPKGERAFNFYHRYSDERTFNANLNKGLKHIANEIANDIAKENEADPKPFKLDFYSARHSWASIARNKCGVSKNDVSLALNHVEMEFVTTDKYIAKDFTRIDKANELVLNCLRSYKRSKGSGDDIGDQFISSFHVL